MAERSGKALPDGEGAQAQDGRPCIFISGGGTSGHVNPALAIAEVLRRRHPELELLFTGSGAGIERELVPRAGYPFFEVPAYPFEANLADLARASWALLRGRAACLRLLRARRVRCVIGTGGYVAGPLLSAAAALGIPRLIHEQNAFPGRSNKMMSRGADVVCISYKDSASYFPKAKRVVWTGNPVAAHFFAQSKEEARARLGIAPDRLLLLATGGSMGARSINEAMIGLAARYERERGAGTRADSPLLVLASGRARYEECLELSRRLGIRDPESLKIEAYLYDMVLYMAAADVVLSRAGAIACAELAALGKAAILVPFPYAQGDHQSHNAAAFVNCGAGLCIKDEDLGADSLDAALTQILSRREGLAAMESASLALAQPEAAERICDEVDRLLRRSAEPAGRA